MSLRCAPADQLREGCGGLDSLVGVALIRRGGSGSAQAGFELEANQQRRWHCNSMMPVAPATKGPAGAITISDRRAEWLTK
jgi:hypothetical protein